jgi:hypothetical protein
MDRKVAIQRLEDAFSEHKDFNGHSVKHWDQGVDFFSPHDEAACLCCLKVAHKLDETKDLTVADAEELVESCKSYVKSGAANCFAFTIGRNDKYKEAGKVDSPLHFFFMMTERGADQHVAGEPLE